MNKVIQRRYMQMFDLGKKKDLKEYMAFNYLMGFNGKIKLVPYGPRRQK